MSALLVTLVLSVAVNGFAQEEPAPVSAPPDYQVVKYKPQYLPPNEILEFLGTSHSGGAEVFRWRGSDGHHLVEIRSNDAANLLVISGTAPDIDHAISLMKEADVPPRQIEIEVKIVEISRSKARNLGLDWQNTMESIYARGLWNYREHNDQISRDVDVRGTAETRHMIGFLNQSGAADIRTAPRILTLNNRPAQILDGQRVTYVIRYGSYTNLYETDSMDAGLNLRVQPSLGESGYITMRITAELTSLSVGRAISGSPIKEGQMLENTIIVRDGESILLGGLSRMVEQKTRKRFPLLGHVLPFLFSREVTNHDQIESFIVLTPHVVDLAASLDEKTKAALEPPGTK